MQSSVARLNHLDRNAAVAALAPIVGALECRTAAPIGDVLGGEDKVVLSRVTGNAVP